MPLPRLWNLLSIVTCLLQPLPAQAGVLATQDFEVTPIGDLVGKYNVGNNAAAQALYDTGWLVGAGCPGYYCPGATVSMVGHTGAVSTVLRLRYEVGPASDSDGSGLEVKIVKECSFGSAFCIGQQQEVWERYYFMTQPVPADTPACTPNCPTTSSVNDVASKQHYFRALNSPMGATFVTDFMFGSKNMSWAQQLAVDCSPNCPNIYGSITLQDNVWYCIETHIKINDVGSANGALELFVNGVPAISSLNRVIQDANHRDAIDNVFIYRQSGGYQWRFEDDYVLSTTRVGCLAADAVAPSAPQSLLAM